MPQTERVLSFEETLSDVGAMLKITEFVYRLIFHPRRSVSDYLL
jgi:hypothetical protein